ncbi:unnamed protein product [Ixodes persulcatus]
MSAAQREPLSMEFSESTELEKYLLPYKGVNQTDLPPSLVIEDDLHPPTSSSSGKPAAVFQDDLDLLGSQASRGETLLPHKLAKVLSERLADNNEQSFSNTKPSQSTSVDANIKGATAANFDCAVQESTVEEYVFPTFPEVPDMQETLLELASAEQASEQHQQNGNGSVKSDVLNVFRKENGLCSRHGAYESDDFDEHYVKMLDARFKLPTDLQQPLLCSSCSQSMMHYVSAIQTLLQQLTVDIIMKGKDPPACSWCAREKMDLLKSRWTSSSFLTDPLLDHNDNQSSRGNMAISRGHQTMQSQSPDSQLHSTPGPKTSKVSLPSGALKFVQREGESSTRLHSPRVEDPESEVYQERSRHAALVQVQQSQENPKQSADDDGQHSLSKVQGVENSSSISPAEKTLQCTLDRSQGGTRSALDADAIAAHLLENNEDTGSHFTENVDLHDESLKRPSELQLHNLGPGAASSEYSSKQDQSLQKKDTRRKSSTSDWMTELVQPLVPEPLEPSVLNQAYVTMANNDLSSMLCMVLGNSLRLSGTSRFLVVLVSDGVSPALRHLLSCVFNIVQSVRSLGTHGTTKLALLEQPDIGVSFTKLHAWRLTQFSKCVFLDAGALVVQNCDELFDRDELSAVPDIGWPDCFNSGVFVYVPSMETFWDLISFAERQGSFDGGDQGLLNTYFRNWSSDINRKLPFIYNLMANVSYTYKPAFKQFGRNVKVVQFFGGYKPWNVKFHPPTGLLSPAADVHSTYVQFVQFWVQIFVKRVLPLFSLSIQEKVHEHRYVCALDILQHFPSSLIAEPVVCLPAPSFRLHAKPSIYLPPGPRLPPETAAKVTTPKVTTPPASLVPTRASIKSNGGLESQEWQEAAVKQQVGVDENCNLPMESDDGPLSFVDDFSGMLAWEQGRADYLGEHRSDNIMARLDELIGSTGVAKAKGTPESEV